MRFTIVLLILSLSSPWAMAQQEQAEQGVWITDDLYTFMHAGPGRNYRILGSVSAGEKVSLTDEQSQDGFTQIIDDKGRTGWIESKFVSSSAGIRQQLTELEAALTGHDDEQNALQSDISRLQQEVNQLASTNRQLDQQLQELQSQNLQLTQELNAQDQSAQMQWLTRGGIIAFAGLILGVIITYLPKKKKRNDQWM